MHPTVKVQGLVREKGTGRPIAGAAVIWNDLFDGHPVAVTDASGTFRGFVAREETFAVPYLIRVPGPFFMPADGAQARQDLPPRGVDEATLEPTELPRGVEVRGTVVDERGEPVAGAEVEAIRPSALPGSARRGPTPRAGSCCTGPIPGPSWSSGPGTAWPARPPCRTPPMPSPPGRSS